MKRAGVGYQRRDPVSHRRLNMARSMLTGSARHMTRTGNFKYVKDGSGHLAGERWGDAKGIDPNSKQKRYSKNSPSFDTGVWWSKKKRQVQDMARKKGGGENVPALSA